MVSTIGAGGAGACPDSWAAAFRPCFVDEGDVFLAKLRFPGGTVKEDLGSFSGTPILLGNR